MLIILQKFVSRARLFLLPSLEKKSTVMMPLQNGTTMFHVQCTINLIGYILFLLLEISKTNYEK